jgi:hypothetical protein
MVLLGCGYGISRASTIQLGIRKLEKELHGHTTPRKT